MRIALAGNPNSGKSTLFNALTGLRQTVGNWPGVTVEKKVGILKTDKETEVVDLPGLYSIDPYSPEEIVSWNYLKSGEADVVLNIVDGTNLERNFMFTSEIAELGLPMVVALNFYDRVKKFGDEIDIEKLSAWLGCPVIPISALKNDGIAELIDAAKKAAKEKTKPNVFKIDIKDEKDLSQTDRQSAVIEARFKVIDENLPKIVKRKDRFSVSKTAKIDKILTNKWLAFPIFAAIIFAVYFVSVSSLGAFLTDLFSENLFGDEGFFITSSRAWLTAIGCAPWLVGLIVDGIIAGVGAVLSFVPQIIILFFLLSILEQCGYMARIAFVFDKIFRFFGLSGKTLIPMLIGTGCGVPAIMATKSINGERERRLAVMTTTFMPCSAKIPVIALISSAIFGGAWWVAPLAYFIGIFAILLSGLILKNFKAFKKTESSFMMELPEYQLPTLGKVLNSTLYQALEFVKKAGTIILLAVVGVWFLSSFGFAGGKFGFVETEQSLLATLGKLLSWVFVPLGFGDWRETVAVMTGLIAKENIISTMEILFPAGIATALSASAGFSFLIFNLLCAPCFAAIGAIKREMHSAKWFWFAIGYQCLFAYVAALIVYWLSRAGATVLVSIIVLAILGLVIYYIIRSKKSGRVIGCANGCAGCELRDACHPKKEIK
ncbi:MAG: ferrous iron transport protein B [Christensenellaceae bacterium]|jgi:ferrous iron transport protein B|nr:ferrous iron transport protein B [Christensenellaceae bacterium]